MLSKWHLVPTVLLVAARAVKHSPPRQPLAATQAAIDGAKCGSSPSQFRCPFCKETTNRGAPSACCCAPKAGSVTHFEAEVLAENIVRYLTDHELQTGYDGHANCFIETGFQKALLIDFNYEVEPLPGHFPTAFGLPLLRESRLNHLGKLLFQWVYWHALLPGRDIPGIGPAMPRSGKKRTPTPTPA